MLIDSHAHINFKEYQDETEQIIKNSLAEHVWLINIGSNYATSKKAIEISEKYPEGVYAAIGIHPIHLLEDITETSVFDGKEYKFTTKQEAFNYQKFHDLAKSSKKVKAIGEVGIDLYYYDDPKKIDQALAVQEQVLEKFVDLAQEFDLPLVIHGRNSKIKPNDAYDKILEILQKKKANRGVIHCYGGNLAQVKDFLDLGFYIGFTGIVTFKNALELQGIAQAVPLEKILIETDAPFLAPHPHRGKRNEPLLVKYVAEKIAELKGLTFDQVAEQTTANARELFRI